MSKLKNKIPKGIRNVKGLSTSDILKMDVYKLQKESFKKVLNRLVSSANKRLRRLEQKAPSSPALRQHQDEDGNLIQFSTKGMKTRNQLEEVMRRVKNFMQAETSTIKGFKAFRKEVESKWGEFESTEQESEFYTAYNEWLATHPNISARFNDSNAILQMFYDEYVVKGHTLRGSKRNVTKALNKLLKEQTAQASEEDARLRNELKNENAFRIKKEI